MLQTLVNTMREIGSYATVETDTKTNTQHIQMDDFNSMCRVDIEIPSPEGAEDGKHIVHLQDVNGKECRVISFIRGAPDPLPSTHTTYTDKATLAMVARDMLVGGEYALIRVPGDGYMYITSFAESSTIEHRLEYASGDGSATTLVWSSYFMVIAAFASVAHEEIKLGISDRGCFVVSVRGCSVTLWPVMDKDDRYCLWTSSHLYMEKRQNLLNLVACRGKA